METKNDLSGLFAPKSVAIVGASDKPGKVGTVIAQNISQLGFEGKTYYVNQSVQELYGQKCYAALSEIEDDVDLAIIAVPAQFVIDVVQSAVEKVKNFAIISAGFAETGAEGKAREEELLTIAEEYNLNILGPNCLGFIIPGLKLNASFAGGMPESGNISFISQSGALAVAIMDIAKKENLRFSNIVSVGNKMQLGEAELLEYLENDDSTKVIGMYLEGIKNGPSFIEVARRVCAKKPIVVLKAGKTAKAQKAISSHTGALAGSDKIMDVAFEKAGVLRTETLEDFFALLKLFSFSQAQKEGKVAVITNAGGAGVITTDAFKDRSIELISLSENSKNELKKFLPAESSLENPIDVLGDAKEDRYAAALEVLDKEDVDSIVCVLTPQEQTPVDEIAKVISGFAQKTSKNIVTSFIGGEKIENGIAYLEACSVPNFKYPEQAVNALSSYFNWNSKIASWKNIETYRVNELRKSQTAEIISRAKNAGKKALLFSEAAGLMAAYGIKTVEAYDVTMGINIPEDVTYPVVVKVDSDTVLHKTDKQGLILGVKNKEQLENARNIIAQNFPGEKMIAQPMKDKHAEIILGITHDSVFGPIIAFGLGGIYTEVFKMVDFLIPPMNEDDIVKAIRDSKISFLFEGVRGQAGCDINEFARILKGLMEFALEAKELKEFDINPLFVYNDGRESLAVDVKIIF